MALPDVLDRIPRPLRPAAEVTVDLAREWKHDRVSGLGAEVAFYAILSLFPGLLALSAGLGSLRPLVGSSAARTVEENVLSFLSDTLQLSPDSTTYEAFANLLDGPSPGLLTFGLVGAVWAMSRGFTALIRALDVVYDLEERRKFVALRGVALGLSLGSVLVGALVLTMVVVGPLFGAGADVADSIGLGGAFTFFWDVLRVPVAALVLIAWVATVFHVAPNHHTPWRADVPGAFATAALALAASLGFSAYLQIASSGNAVFGVLGSAISLLLWLYVLSLAVLIGGELNAILWTRKGEDKAEGGRPSPGTAQK